MGFFVDMFLHSSSSEASGNCLYSSVSLALVGDNSLRVLSCAELFLYPEFYSKHPSFCKCLEENKTVFHSIESILKASVSDKAFNTDSSGDLVKAEAVANCHNYIWSFQIFWHCLLSQVSQSLHITQISDKPDTN